MHQAGKPAKRAKTDSKPGTPKGAGKRRLPPANQRSITSYFGGGSSSSKPAPIPPVPPSEAEAIVVDDDDEPEVGSAVAGAGDADGNGKEPLPAPPFEIPEVPLLDEDEGNQDGDERVAAGEGGKGKGALRLEAGKGDAGGITGSPVDKPCAQYDPVKDACWEPGRPAPYIHLAWAFELLCGTTKRIAKVRACRIH
jgi:hypothetical protein